MRLVWTALFIAGFPFALFAQQLTVLSGEHDGFTRLVAPLPSGASWTVEHLDNTVIFSILDKQPDFEVSGVFDLIKRDRISEISLREDGFALTLGCDCLVAPYVLQDRFVVLDVASPGVSRPAAFVTQTQSQNSPTEVAAMPAVELPTVAPALDAMLPFEAPAQSPLQPVALPELARKPLSDVEQEALDEIQQRLARELGTAATRGVLTPLSRAALPKVRRAQVDLSNLPKLDETPSPEVITGQVNNMRITSSMDIPNRARANGNSQSVSGFECTANEELDLPSWVDDRAFHLQTGEARRALYGEFDKLDKSAALKLAKIYIYFGFGAEAQRALLLDPGLEQENPLLADIARILEKGHASQNSMLRSLLDCETDVALWAILAREDLRVAHTINPKAALLALNKLPVHLRTFLAPALSRRLLSHGDTEAAATALRNLERLPSELPSAAKLAQANIALDEGNVAKANTALGDVIDDNAEQSPEALITLVETQLNANQPIDHNTASLIEAYAKELNGGPLGAQLRRAHVLALAKSGQFDRAFASSAELGGTGEDEAAIELRLRLLEQLTLAAEDVIFLDHVFEQASKDIDRLPMRQKLALVDRLVDLGFSGEAAPIIAGVPARPRIDARQILAARIAIDLNQPKTALAELVNMTGEDVDQLRATALQIAGNHEDAYAIYLKLENESAAARSAWLADDWDRLTLADDQILGPVLALSNVEGAQSTQTAGMLARSAAALNESEAARETLTNMLRAPQVGITENPSTE